MSAAPGTSATSGTPPSSATQNTAAPRAAGVRNDLSRYLSPAHRGARFVAQRLLLRPVTHLILTVRTRGDDALRTARNEELLRDGFLLASNHTSHLDAVLIVTQLPWSVSRNLAFGAAADYFYRVSWRRWLTGLFFNTFPVDRDGSGTGRGMAFRLVEAGVPVALFPEGTRSRDGKLRRFTPGAALVARRERVPVIPVAVRGAHRAMPAGRAVLPRWGRPRVELVVGEPLVAHSGERIPDFSQRIEDAVRSMLDTGTPSSGESA